MQLGHWQISKQEYDILLNYVGCGNFPGADIIVFGNEEGTGGYSVEANVKARTKAFGRFKEDGEYQYCIVPGDPTKGFYELSSSSGGSKVEAYLKDSEKLQHQGFTAGVFNPSIARICLSVEQPNGTNWFEGTVNNEAWAAIKNYVVNDLYRARQGIQTALADWRPLPRENESVWCTEEYGLIAPSLTNNPFLGQFNNPLRKRRLRTNTNMFSDYYSDMLQRADTLKRTFELSKAKVIIGIGGASGFKKLALQRMFGNVFTPLVFEKPDMRNARGTEIKAFMAKIQLENKDLHVFLLPFPSAGTVFRTQKDTLLMLQELSEKYIQPIING
jgi:hypothetical protein